MRSALQFALDQSVRGHHHLFKTDLIRATFGAGTALPGVLDAAAAEEARTLITTLAADGDLADRVQQAQRMDEALQFIYDREFAQRAHRKAGPGGGEGVTIPAWLRGVRELFPKEAVEIIERDALDRYGMTELVTDPEILRSAEPSPALLKAILQFKHLMRPEVLDVAQESFLKAYRAMPKFRGDSAFYTWLYRIAINTAKNHLVSQARRLPESAVDSAEAEQSPAPRSTPTLVALAFAGPGLLSADPVGAKKR